MRGSGVADHGAGRAGEQLGEFRERRTARRLAAHRGRQHPLPRTGGDEDAMTRVLQRGDDAAHDLGRTRPRFDGGSGMHDDVVAPRNGR
jgi:hypothetical protein